MGKLKRILLKIGRWLGIFLLAILALFILVVILIRTPWAQKKITNYATSYVSDKTGTRLDIERLFVTFTGNVQLEGLYAEDLQGDTLVYSRSLEAGVGVSSLISGNISISKVEWDGLKANITRGKDSLFNFNFFMEAFAGGSDTASTPADTATSPMPQISLGPIDFTDFKITYLDSIAGMDAYLRLGSLSLTTDDFDLEKMAFELDGLTLRNTEARVLQFLQPPPSEDTSSAPMPFLSWDEILLENVAIHYRTQPDTLEADASIGRLYLDESELALEEQRVEIAAIEWMRSDVSIRMPAPSKNSNSTASAEVDSSAAGFTWPGWQVSLDELEFAENNISIHRGKGTGTPRTFDPNHLEIKNLRLGLQEALLEDRHASLSLEELSFTERSGFAIQQFSFDLDFDADALALDDLTLQTRHSLIAAQLDLSYPNIDSLLANPAGNTSVQFLIGDETSLSLRDAFYFNDSLRQDSLMQVLAPYPVEISAALKGQLSDLRIDELEVKALRTTNLSMRGRINGLPDTNALQVAIPKLDLRTTKADLAFFVDTSASEFPQYVMLQSSLNGNMRQLAAELDLSTPKGKLALKTRLRDLMKIPSYKGKLEIDNLEVGQLTGNPDLGPVSMQLDFDGRGTKPENLRLETAFDFKKLTYRSYDYSALKLAVHVEDRLASLQMSHADSNLNFNLDLEALLDTNTAAGNLRLDLNGIDLQDLNFATGRTKMAFNLNAGFEGTPSDFNADLSLTNGVFIRGESTERLDSLHAAIANDSSRSFLTLYSQIIEGEVQSNTSLQTLASSLQTYLGRAMGSDSAQADSTYSKLDMKGNFVVKSNPLLTDFLLPGLERMDSISINTAFAPAKNKLVLDVSAPKIVYKGIDLENLAVDINSSGDSTKVDFSFDRLERSPIDMHRTTLNIDLAERSGNAVLEILDENENEVFYTALDIARQGEIMTLKVDPSHLTLNGNPWEIPEGNSIKLGEQTIFDQFRLSRNQQELAIQSNPGNDEMQITFNGLRLSSLFSIFNAEESPVTGMLNGNVKLVNLSQTPAFVADVTLNELGVMNNPVGRLTLDANNRGGNSFDLNMALKGEQIDLVAKGGYITSGGTQNLNLDFDLNKLGMKLVQGFAPAQIDSARGYLSGTFDVNGSADAPQFEGQLIFNKVGLTPTMLGTDFRLGNEKIEMDNEGLYFDDFTLADANGNTTEVDGEIGLESMTNPTFELSVKAEKFRLLNSTAEDNESYYGTAILDLDVDVQGDLSLPVVKARVKLRDETDVTYVIPASQARIESRTGIVRFRNMKDSTDVLSQEEEEASGSITGYDVSALISLTPGTRFTVVVDPQSGDNITVAGEADLDLNLSPNGNMTLTGSYELSDGSYQLNLYELVKKKFDLVKGSRIVWTGDPQGARLDITAVYRTETSPASLMAEQAGGTQRSLPFEVQLFIEGTINEPRISFGLDMPEDSRGAQGGSVYSRIRQLNENEAELNKQVFSLIVFDRFLPTGSVSDDGGNSDLARSSVSKLLTGQLNKLADQYIKGVELNIDVDSYQESQGGQAQNRTDLNVSLKKAFFDERVVVEVGSQVGIEGQQQQNSAIIGDVSLEYLLDEDGTYRLRAFRNNQFQNLVEGQVIITGLGILFSKQFDTWKELWQKEEKASENAGDEKPNQEGTKPDTGEEENDTEKKEAP